jgi:DMSO reductase anchor subunit
MRPAYSVIFLTTLIGAGQGLLLALIAADAVRWPMAPTRTFLVAGAGLAILLAGLGLVASFFHLGRPERAWRSAAMWRTSWLSREVIALPLFMALVAAWGLAHYRVSGHTLAIGSLALAACLALFVCTAMIYACVKFLQEWASPYTIANVFLMGTASGFTLAAALAGRFAPGSTMAFGIASIALTAIAYFTRLASLGRNEKIQHKSTLQTAIGVNHPKVRQVSQGFTVRSFNTEEFFHGAPASVMGRMPFAFLTLGFMLPMVVVATGVAANSFAILALAFAVQYAGLFLERWFFLAQSNHPQNLYYQSKA